MSLILAPTMTLPDRVPRRRGRPANAADPAKREYQLKFVGLFLSGVLMAKQAAPAAGVSPRTLTRWKNELIAEGLVPSDPSVLRSLAARLN